RSGAASPPLRLHLKATERFTTGSDGTAVVQFPQELVSGSCALTRRSHWRRDTRNLSLILFVKELCVMGLLTSPEFCSLNDLFVQQLEDLYDAENRLIDALPKMADAATCPDLKNA